MADEKTWMGLTQAQVATLLAPKMWEPCPTEWVHPDEFRRRVGDEVAEGHMTPAEAVDLLRERGLWPRRLRFARTGPCPTIDALFQGGDLFAINRRDHG